MTQKVLKVGTSAAVTIPKESLKELGLKIGDSVRLEVDIKRRMVSIEPVALRVNDELLKWTDGFIKQYRSALNSLAKK